jgi:hypothetical protein
MKHCKKNELVVNSYKPITKHCDALFFAYS